MSFQTFYEEELRIKLPKPNNSITHTLNLKEYKELISKSVLSKDKKQILRNVVDLKGEFPIYNETAQKFYMTPFKGKKLKAREVKSREDKEMCGVLLNSMINNAMINENTEEEKYLENLKVGWEMPAYVFKKINKL
jgi:hypothetical protein